MGLSPRVRGNLRPEEGSSPLSGSIPACTGEPGWGSRTAPSSWVYPRVYGGTSTEFIRLFVTMSLFLGA